MASLAGVVPGILDAHFHQWDPFTTPREASRLAPLYRRAPRLLTALFPVLVDKGARDLVLTPEHAATPYLPETYATDVAGVPDVVGVPVEAAVHVEADWQSADPVEETAWLEDLPFAEDGRPALAAIVGHADPRRHDIGDVLDRHLAASPRFRGIRCMATWHDDPKVKRWADRPRLLRDPGFLRGFAAVAERGLTFDAYVYSHQLDDVAVLAREYPDTTIVLDHYAPLVGWAGPMGSGTGRTPGERAGILARWRDGIGALASYDNVVAKHSGLAFPMHGLREVGIGRERLARTMAPLVTHTQDCFGPDRVLFGSNFPMDKSVTTYPVVVGALVDLLAPYGEDALRKAFRDNARRVYRD
ncbi:MAG TPA: amidohydrolase family protein [Nocardioides sp.]|nr:amidohydrolase family protein [Nocardioides sp.]